MGALSNKFRWATFSIVAALASAQGAAAHGLTQNDLDLIANATGYVLGQKYVLAEIRRRYPAYTDAVSTFEDGWNRRYPNAEEKLTEHLTRFGVSADRVEKIKANILAGSKPELDRQISSSDAASRVLLDFAIRTEMPNPRLRDVLIMLDDVVYDDHPEREFELHPVPYSSAESPKTHGWDVRLTMPASWQMADIYAGKLVQGWMKYDGLQLLTMTLGYSEANEVRDWRQEAERLKTDESFLSLFTAGKVLERQTSVVPFAGSVALEDRNVVQQQKEGSDERLYRASVLRFVMFGKNLFVTAFSVVAQTAEQARATLKKNEALLAAIHDSVTIFPPKGEPLAPKAAKVRTEGRAP